MPAAPGTKPIKPLKKGMGLYQVLYWPNEAKKAGYPSKPWAVVNLRTRDVNGRWHATREEALAQARALYARLGAKAKVQTESDNLKTVNAYFFSASTLVGDEEIKWVEAIAPKTYTTPGYGDVVITGDKLDNFISNFNNNVRGQEIAIDYEHGQDPAKGKKAAGWISGVRANNETGKLELGVKFTPNAKREILDGEWKYFSLEWDDAWLHPDGVYYSDVMMGGALTNRPVAKDLMPINFSEIFSEENPDYEFAVWSTAYKNSLPDSSFAYIAPGGKKDSDGKTQPRSLRFFPYKDASGKVDLTHVRNMVAQAPKAHVPDAIKSRVQALGRRLLGAKSMAEMGEIDSEFVDSGPVDEHAPEEHSNPGTGNPPAPRLDEQSGIDEPDRQEGWRRQTPPIVEELESNADTAVDEVEVIEEITEPVLVKFSESEAIGYLTSAKAGLNRIHTNAANQLIDKIDSMLDQDFRTRSFRELQALVTETRTMLRGEANSDGNGNGHSQVTNPLKGGSTVGELTEKDLRELRNVLDVDDDGRILEAVKVRFGELHALRDAVSASEQERIFAEQYPQFYEQHLHLMERDRRNTARNFSEGVQKVRKAEGYGLKDTRMGLSVACLEKVQEAHMKFSEGKGSIDDFEEVVKAITNGGIVQFGEIGSSVEDSIPEIDTSSAVGVAGARKVFAEIVAKVQRDNPEMNMLDAIAEASKKAPDLAESYKLALPA